MHPNVPFKEILYPPTNPKGPSHNQTVIAVKRAASRFGVWPWNNFDDYYNIEFSLGKKEKKANTNTSGIAGFQKIKGLKADGIYGAKTHDTLLNSKVPNDLPHAGEWCFDQGAITLYNGYDDMSDAERIVADYYKWWDFLFVHEPAWHYSMNRPNQPLYDKEDPPKLPSWDDCSGTFEYCAFLADAMPPDTINRYTGYGNTDSLIHCGQVITENQIAQYCKDHVIGVFYGNSIWHTVHVAAVKNAKEIYSHGKESGPNKYNSIHYGHPYPIVGLRAYRVI